jgi:hypothetical protein
LERNPEKFDLVFLDGTLAYDSGEYSYGHSIAAKIRKIGLEVPIISISDDEFYNDNVMKGGFFQGAITKGILASLEKDELLSFLSSFLGK